MYRDAGQWEEALRVVKAKGSTREAAELALEWAHSVGAEVGGKLIQRQGMADDCIALACQKEQVKSTFLIIHFTVGLLSNSFSLNSSLNLLLVWLKLQRLNN